MAERYIKEIDFQAVIDNKMNNIKFHLENKNNEDSNISIRDCYLSQQYLVNGIVSNTDMHAEHIYREDIIKQTIELCHEHIFKSINIFYENMKDVENLKVDDFLNHMDMILSTALKNPDNINHIINKIIK